MSKPKRYVQLFVCVIAIILALCFLIFSKQVSQGAKQGVDICLSVVVPSLFPFMILSSFISGSSISSLVSRPFSPLTTRVFKLDSRLGAAVFMSFIGGYPIGAKMVSSLVKGGVISDRTASRMLCFCINSGPSFLISAVGAGILGDLRVGALLYLAQVLASVTIALFLPRDKQAVEQYRPPQPKPFSGAFVQSVYDSCDAMLRSCGFIVFFSALLPLVISSGAATTLFRMLSNITPPLFSEQFFQSILTGLLEVTSGCISAAQCSSFLPYLLLPLFVSFSRLSVIFQVSSYFLNTSVNLKPFYFSRLIAPLLTLLYFAPLLPLLGPKSLDAMAMTGSTVLIVPIGGREFLITLCLLGMACLLLLTLHSRLFVASTKKAVSLVQKNGELEDNLP